MGSVHDTSEGDHLFRVGQREVLDVQPCPPALADGRDRWSCSCCGDEFARVESWCLQYRVQPGKRLTFVVCPACAHDLVPVRVTVDVSEAATVSTSRDPEGAVEQLVRRVASQRHTDATELRLRSSDVVELASQLGMGRVQLVLRLREAGLVIDL